jgi:flagellar biogenesis protein FliO
VFIKTLGAMLVVVGLIFGGAWLARKFGFSNVQLGEQDPEHALAVMRTVALGTGRTVSTLRFGDRVLLVGSTPQSISLLAEVPVDADKTRQPRRSVAEMLDDEDAGFAIELADAERRIAASTGGDA